MNKNKIVSVYISTCNRYEKLKRAVNSVLQQSYPHFEVLICDDASTDETQAYATNLSIVDKRVKYFRNEENKGACAARNLGVFAASGYFITGLDDDDEFTVDRLQYFIDNWDERYSFLCANFTNIFSDGGTPYYNNRDSITFNFESMLFDNVASNQVFTLTSRLQAIEGFDVNVRRLQDWDTWLRLSYAFGNFIRLPRSTYKMHHDHSKDAIRVSKSYSFLKAFEEIGYRNSIIYGERNLLRLRYLILFYKRELSFREACHWFTITKSFKNIVRYFFQFFLKRKLD
ncbi:glycosyltransferase [Gibbsiella dentisursi]|uniref:Glycosyltransferase n=1 Tax=Gibbsiella dentisursi TaxID=796890 RepID=A0ABP7KQG9_9GAMM